jgi:hypothetical protein
MELIGLVAIAIIITVVRSAWRGAGSGSSQPARSQLPPYRGGAMDRETPDEAFASGYIVGRYMADDEAGSEADAPPDRDWSDSDSARHVDVDSGDADVDVDGDAGD